jgi:hypothetical protein
MLKSIEEHLGSREVSRVIYGAIIGLALVVALEEHPPSAGVMVATILGTAVAVALAEVYSDVIGTETRTRARVRGAGFRSIVDEAVAVAFGIGFPAVFFILAAAGAMEVKTAFTVAKWTGLGLIGFYGFCAARLAGRPLLAALFQASVVGAIGGGLIGLKALVH